MPSAFSHIHLKEAVIVDTETTGIELYDEVIEIAIVDAQSGDAVLHHQLQPTCFIHKNARAIHGITDYELLGKPDYKDIVVELNPYHEKVFIGWRVNFDLRLIAQTAKKRSLDINWQYGVRFVDLKTMYCKKRGFNESDVHLIDACKYENIDISDLIPHRALADCQMVYRLLHKIINED